MTTGNTSSNFHRLNARTFTVTLPIVISLFTDRHAFSASSCTFSTFMSSGAITVTSTAPILDHDGVAEDRHLSLRLFAIGDDALVRT